MNKMTLKFSSLSINESFSRSVISCFILPLKPSIAELTDIKTAVSEVVTNAIVHGYEKGEGVITMEAKLDKNKVHIKISDKGVGIKDLDKAMEPFFTTKPEEERSGMGFTIIKTFMENVKVKSSLGKGTIVSMTKTINSK